MAKTAFGQRMYRVGKNNPYASWSADHIRREMQTQRGIVNEKRILALMSYPAKTSPAYKRLTREINAARKAYDAANDKLDELRWALTYAEIYNQDMPF